MKLAIYIKDSMLAGQERYVSFEGALKAAGHDIYRISVAEDLLSGTDMLLSVGGDGTFLSAAKRVGDSGIPVMGVNLGRLGFLSENSPEDVLAALSSGDWTVEERELLHLRGKDVPADMYPCVLNEVALHRRGAAMLGIKVKVDGTALPTYWADGLLIATSSGSTAYSLSVGGPICAPEAKVLIIAPIAPHNMNVRPLIVPDSAVVSISTISRDGEIMLSADNRSATVPSGGEFTVSLAQFSLRRVRLGKESFVRALTSKLYWGGDVRNSESK
ncbi:MAG: NAD(+)/NADH kinase [Bacteroidales bacterium]|nr:NAD(+)/NADH kinase [Bacteroidales bacterium]